LFEGRLAWPCWTAVERDGWTRWGATFATKKTMGEMMDYLSVERQRRKQATHEEAA
jgi:hypothetical protein